MTDNPEIFKEDYRRAFRAYLDGPNEGGLQEAYELGRRAIGTLSALNIAEVHHDELAEALAAAKTREAVETVARAGAAFFVEALSTFEMTQRGYFEAQQMYEREHNVAEILQQSLLPERLPEIPGVEIETLYRPGGLGFRVGGDFYDVFQVNENQWALVVGDVCGKGPRAASLTALCRNTIRVGAIRSAGPESVLNLLNEAIVRYGSGDFCTLLYVLFTKDGPVAKLDVGCAGHPAPYVVRSEGALEKVECEGMLVGVLGDVSHSNWSMEMRSGDCMVMYTDGVIEGRIGGDFFGESRLRSVLEGCSGFEAEKVVAALGDALEEVEDGPHRDDMAILAVRVV
ncbi:MAG: PP2C family protein-serine/threonine phosphatase [Actinomycetota bacterium]